MTGGVEIVGDTSFIEKLSIESYPIPLYKRIKDDKNPIFIWGCGNVATSVYHYCRRFHIEIAGCFIDTEKNSRMFEDMPVLSLSEVAAKCTKFSVIIGHAHYLEGTTQLRRVENVAAIYCVTSCAYDIWDKISIGFLEEHAQTLDQLYGELRDELSKRCMATYFESRVNDRAEHIFPCVKRVSDYYSNDILALTNDEVLLDVGAWEGAAIWPFIEAVGGTYRHIIALEPDARNFGKLCENIKSQGIKDITAKMVCAYDKDEMVKFEVDPADGQMGGVNELAENYRMCPAVKIDSLCRELDVSRDVSILKINFSFAVSNVLKGAAELLKNRRPKIIVRAGFEENGLLDTYITIKKINPNYKFYFRYTVEMPQGLTLFAI